MVGLPVSTPHLVTAYQFVASYEILKLIGVGSIVAIGWKLINLPKPVRPAANGLHAPYVRAVRAWRRLIFLGLALMLLTAAMLVAHFRIPADIGKPVVPPTPQPDLEEFRSRLITFFLLLIPVACVNVWFWWTMARFSSSKAS
jgi:hypothetical protein